MNEFTGDNLAYEGNDEEIKPKKQPFRPSRNTKNSSDQVILASKTQHEQIHLTQVKHLDTSGSQLNRPTPEQSAEESREKRSSFTETSVELQQQLLKISNCNSEKGISKRRTIWFWPGDEMKVF